MRYLALILCLLATPSAAQDYVRDADTIVLNGQAYRLNGVDAAERDHPTFAPAKAWMERYLRGKYIECQWTGEWNGDRLIAVCYADGVDIGAAVIAAGHALECRRYSGGRYTHLETAQARASIRRARYC